ncbi:Hemolysin, contains CBS domains [Corynebacterium pollutisoli]|uniref:Hemolysin, contains CBS domains n=2 Tax=Corynebacterium pollutisoli TaxID=1610489 RepID=A0A1X7JPR5_9CORY|nr:hemolysin family protein [Corynebacterium pollutisoli]NLP38895.1 HlyC/CorC family transporter [Corynebacterium pollutisoli]SMG29899.1 Hemolysin, contains CBS domains [Corynebacterium pollutisoli]HJD78270.1 hemolysin family protein [Corynebacterium pollutisoli]
MNIFTTILMIVALLAANAFFVAAEFALISSRKDRIESLIAQGKPAARKVLYATEHLSIMLAGAQFGITIASLILGKVAEPAVAHFIEGPFQALGIPDNLLHPISFVIALAFITFLHILFGEMVPKNIAIAGPETLAMWLTPAMIWWVKITRPLIEFMNWIARITLRAFGIEQKDELDSTVDEAQLAFMIKESREEGLLDAEETQRLSQALRSEKRSLKEVMIPLGKVRTLDFGRRGPTLGELEQAVVETGFSRFPVTGTDGSFLGYIHVKDVLDRLATAGPEEFIPRSDLRPLTIVDGTGTMDEALRKLHRRSAHMAQVRDRGELIGVLTLEDLIEEYVGTVNDWTHGDA